MKKTVNIITKTILKIFAYSPVMHILFFYSFILNVYLKTGIKPNPDLVVQQTPDYMFFYNLIIYSLAFYLLALPFLFIAFLLKYIFKKNIPLTKFDFIIYFLTVALIHLVIFRTSYYNWFAD